MGWRDDSVDWLIILQAWVQISKTHVKSWIWSREPETPAIQREFLCYSLAPGSAKDHLKGVRESDEPQLS